MTRAEWAALIARVEAAEGPSRELDAEIARLFLPSGAEEITLSRNAWKYRIFGGTGWDDEWLDIRPYTASLDAAAALVPSGHPWQLCQLTEPPSGSARRPVEFSAQVRHAGDMNRWALTHAATPALALTAAALRARMAMEGEG